METTYRQAAAARVEAVPVAALREAIPISVAAHTCYRAGVEVSAGGVQSGVGLLPSGVGKSYLYHSIPKLSPVSALPCGDPAHTIAKPKQAVTNSRPGGAANPPGGGGGGGGRAAGAMGLHSDWARWMGCLSTASGCGVGSKLAARGRSADDVPCMMGVACGAP